jgi:predicted acyltransferase
MILVNTQGSGEHPFPGLAHAPWNGCTPADLVFPAFLFVVGVSFAFVLERARERGRLGAAFHRTMVRRAAVLALIGVAMNAFPRPDWAELRYLGVLQRIALCYLIAGLVAVHLRPRQQRIAAGAVLVGYWLALTVVPVPGLGHAAMTEAHNLPGVIDRAVFGAAHVYGNGGYDPEGLLSTLPAAVTVLAGIWIGQWLRRREPSAAVSRQLALWGAGAVAAGLAWSTFFPPNKRLWTSSFTLLTTGAALLGLAALFHLVDVSRRERLSRLLTPLGRNAIVVFVGSEEMAYYLQKWSIGDRTMRQWGFAHLDAALPAPVASLAYALVVLGFWWLVAEAMHRRRWYVSV